MQEELSAIDEHLEDRDQKISDMSKQLSEKDSKI